MADISCYLSSMHKGRPKTSKKVKSETRVLEFFHFNKKIDIINFCSKESRIILAKIGCTVHAFWNFLVVCVSLSKEYFITRVAFQNGKRPICPIYSKFLDKTLMPSAPKKKSSLLLIVSHQKVNVTYFPVNTEHQWHQWILARATQIKPLNIEERPFWMESSSHCRSHL